MANDLQLKVRFTQEITIHPPENIERNYEAEVWWKNNPSLILRDAIDVDRGDVEILEIND